jgi:hypothetical protein
VTDFRTRFRDFDNPSHPFQKWWKEHGQYMRSGGGRNEMIWACRGWIAREQMTDGVEITGDSLNERRPHRKWGEGCDERMD